MAEITAIEFFNGEYAERIKAGDCIVLDSFGDEIESITPNEWVVYYKSKEHEWLSDEDGRLNNFTVKQKATPTPDHVAEMVNRSSTDNSKLEAAAKALYETWFNDQHYEAVSLEEGYELDRKTWLKVSEPFHALEAENARLREALKPFADAAASMHSFTGQRYQGVDEHLPIEQGIVDEAIMNDYGVGEITVANLQQASAVLSEEPHEP